MKYQNMSELVGNTPHVRVNGLSQGAANLYVKLESYNPTGSLKDRACLSILRQKTEEGALQPSMTLLDASSGNMACAIAYYGRMLGHPATVVVNSKLTEDKRNFLRYFGATIHQVGDFTIEGNRWCRELVEKERSSRYCFLDQLHNWANPKAYYETLGPEVVEAFPDLEMVVGSLGSGGTMTGVGEFLRHHKPGVKVIAVQAAAGTRLPGTASFDDGDYVTPFIQKAIDERIFDDMVKITERDAIERISQLREKGVFVGLQTGGVLHAALESARRFDVRGDVVMISGDSGWKNMDKLLHIGCQNN